MPCHAIPLCSIERMSFAIYFIARIIFPDCNVSLKNSNTFLASKNGFFLYYVILNCCTFVWVNIIKVYHCRYDQFMLQIKYIKIIHFIFCHIFFKSLWELSSSSIRNHRWIYTAYIFIGVADYIDSRLKCFISIFFWSISWIRQKRL